MNLKNFNDAQSLLGKKIHFTSMCEFFPKDGIKGKVVGGNKVQSAFALCVKIFKTKFLCCFLQILRCNFSSEILFTCEFQLTERADSRVADY